MVSLPKKLKWPKTCEKRFCKHVRVVLCKNPLEKTPYIREMRPFLNGPSCKGYRLWKMVSLAEKFKWPETSEKRFYEHVRVVLCKKPLEKHKYSRNETILKIGHLGKPIDFATWSVWLKNSNGQKRAKNDSTSTLELFCGKKTARKNTKHSRNEIILKIGHLPKAIDFAKWSVWLKNSKGQKRAKKDSTSPLELFFAKNRWKKNTL